jgi:hypothetical protein
LDDEADPVQVLLPDVVSSKTLTAGSGRIGVATALTQVAMESVPPDPSGQFVADKM